MTKIIFATGNEGKMREIRDIMADLDVELLSMKEAGIKLDIVEDGKTSCLLCNIILIPLSITKMDQKINRALPL
jgi:inosine/xanthosine triphosphate pyrophosphatase family protein